MIQAEGPENMLGSQGPGAEGLRVHQVSGSRFATRDQNEGFEHSNQLAHADVAPLARVACMPPVPTWVLLAELPV